ncbi:ATP-binding protein [Virgibacillus kimchii]
MKILSATIYGFGKWIDYSIDFHEDGFTCIYGENESGKSTLQQFVLFMLFGLPPKQRNFYRPKTSGKMGGRLTVEDLDTGVFTIERLDEVNNGAATCYTEDGKAFDEAWLDERLKGMTKKTYQSIFSFSSMDLQVMNNMKEDDLAEILLGIGMTGSTKIYAVEKKLEQQIGDLYKQRGTKPLINKQLTSLDHLHTQLQEAKRTEETYKELKDRQSELNGEISAYQESLHQKRKTVKWIEQQQQALPYIQDYLTAEKHLAAYPDTIPFPEQGISRLEKIKDQWLPLKSEQNVLQDNEQKYKQKVASLQEELAKFPWDRVTRLLKMKDNHELRNRAFQQHEESLKKINAQIDNELEQLDIPIAEEELAALHLPFHVERQWQDLKNNTETNSLEQEKTDQEKEELDRQEHFVTQKKEKLKAEMLPEHHKKELEDRIKSFQEQSQFIKWQENANNQQKELEKNKQNKMKHANRLLAGSLLLGLVLGGSGIFLDLSMLYFFMMASILIGIIMWYGERKSLKEMTVLLEKNVRELQRPDITLDEKEEAEQLLACHEDLELQWRALEDQGKKLYLERLKWEEKRSFMEEKNKQLHKQLAEQWRQYPFLQKLDVRYWPEVYHRLKQILQLIRDKRRILENMDEIIEENAYLENEVKAFFPEETLPVEAALESLEKIWESANNSKKQMEYYNELLDENIQNQGRLKQKRQVYEKEMDDLFSYAEVSSEDEFYEKAKQIEEKAAYEEGKLKAKAQLSRFLPETDLESLLLDQPVESTLINRQQNTKETMEELELTLDVKRDELAGVYAKLDQMEASESYSSLMHEMEMGQEELKHLMKKWAVFKTAKEMLLETKRNYRDKYLDQVMKKTTEYFAALTDGGYTKVFAPDKEKSFYAVSRNGIRYHVNELSRGTVDQLYVSLRLAISNIMSREYRIPFIIDDAFIHFDNIRTKRMMELLSGISDNKQQMIIFTCRKEVANLVTSSQVIELESKSKMEELSKNRAKTVNVQGIPFA